MKLKLGTKISVLFVVILLAFSSVIGLIVSNQVRDGIKEFAVEKAKSDLNLAYSLIDATYPGEWKIENGQFYKGDILLNDNFEVVDKIGNDTGGTVTIFHGDTRITTNVLVDGKRAIGTKISDEVGNAVLTNKQMYYGEADVAGNTYQAAYKPLMNNAGEVIGIFYVGASQQIIDTIISGFIKTFFFLLIGSLIVSVVIITLYAGRIRKRLKNVTDVLVAAGKGDFTHHLHDQSGDELTDVATSYNRMVNNLKNLLKQVMDTSTLVENASYEMVGNSKEMNHSTLGVTNSVTHISQNMTQQQQMMEQSAHAINEMTAGISQVSENTASVAEASLASMNKAVAGQSTVRNVVTQMSTIYTSNERTNVVIHDLEQRSMEIGNIVEAITTISEQTNLLALNAAIESARAGEHGKGFAVVADEVRKLSEQSHSSASMISTIVEGIQHDTKMVAQLMGNTHSEIANGISMVKDTGETFNEIVGSIELSNAQIQELSSVAEEMTASMEEINASIESVAQLANTTAQDANNITSEAEEQLALTEQVTSSVESLTVKSAELKQLTNQFKI